jgi:hypothetical protein
MAGIAQHCRSGGGNVAAIDERYYTFACRRVHDTLADDAAALLEDVLHEVDDRFCRTHRLRRSLLRRQPTEQPDTFEEMTDPCRRIRDSKSGVTRRGQVVRPNQFAHSRGVDARDSPQIEDDASLAALQERLHPGADASIDGAAERAIVQVNHGSLA